MALRALSRGQSECAFLVESFSPAFGIGRVYVFVFFFSSRRRHTRSVSAFLLNRSSDLGASLNIRHNLSSSKGPKPLQLKLLTTYIPKTSAFTLAFSTSQRLRTTRASARTFFTFRHYITPSARNF